MLDNGADRFVTTASSTDAAPPPMDECPNFSEVVGDPAPLRRAGQCRRRRHQRDADPLLRDSGVGETHFAKRLAKAMATECELIA